jgi:hypothetical protein
MRVDLMRAIDREKDRKETLDTRALKEKQLRICLH